MMITERKENQIRKTERQIKLRSSNFSILLKRVCITEIMYFKISTEVRIECNVF